MFWSSPPFPIPQFLTDDENVNVSRFSIYDMDINICNWSHAYLLGFIIINLPFRRLEIVYLKKHNNILFKVYLHWNFQWVVILNAESFGFLLTPYFTSKVLLNCWVITDKLGNLFASIWQTLISKDLSIEIYISKWNTMIKD